MGCLLCDDKALINIIIEANCCAGYHQWLENDRNGVKKLRPNQKEIEKLRELMAEVDKGINVPLSLSGDILRHKLEDIPAPEERKPFAFSRVFSFQSAASYAVMFALIVAVVYSMRYTNQAPPLVEGQFSVSENATTFDEAAEVEIFSDVEYFDVPKTEESIVIDRSAGVVSFAAPLEQADIMTGGASPSSALTDNSQNSAHTGGSGQSHPLGESGGYQISWRENDPSDIDKAGSPVTVEIIAGSSSLISQVNISNMDIVSGFIAEGDALVILGSAAGVWVINSYIGFEDLQPEFTGSMTMPGASMTKRIYQDVVYAVSYIKDTSTAPVDIERIPIEGSNGSGICYIGAIDIKTGETNLVGFDNACEDITLFDRHAYISLYDEEDAKVDKVVQIELSGTAIELIGIH